MSKIDFDKIIEGTLGVEVKHLQEEEVFFSKKLMKAACIQVLDEAAERARNDYRLALDAESILQIKEEL